MSQVARMLDDMLTRLLSGRLSHPAASEAPSLPDELRAEMAQAGLHLVLAPEEKGGFGCRMTEAATVAWRCGWHAAPVPIVEMLLTPVLRTELGLGLDSDVALVHPTPDYSPEADKTSQPRMPVLSVRGQNIPIPRHIAAKGMLLHTALMTGAMAKVVEITADYARTRVQFGRPLAKFQATQHALAEAGSELAVTEAALAAALEAEDEGRGSELLRLSAKAQAGVAATVIAATSHQVFGAIGFTQEHELQRYTRSLWAWRDEWGRQAACNLSLGRAACSESKGLWPYLTDEARIIA
ncbi:acyl-CoA dehydrogenase family protein [uncultured Paracoccus sp.]|uniref:acyl-CoA dehydrogenase family protein n=1 Tax=uncultured Paracoccus sp. TaxID=189685 RepID=UPI0026034680|nr:acyl-CoA dehydrogenase family protein [uncultured Paracoccus sp.]